MGKRPIIDESSSKASKRQAVTHPQDEEDPLPSASSSLAQQESYFSILKMPLDLIADSILPFVADRTTWNSVYSASKELHEAGKKMTPPWPSKSFKVGYSAVPHVAFSRAGSQLAFCILNRRTDQCDVHVWDRWGKETILGGHTRGHTGHICCLEYDEEHLASGSLDGSIRIWRIESCHATSSQTHREGPTRTSQHADRILLCRGSIVMALSFSRTDSNLLASGGYRGEIKLWNVEEQACIRSFNSRNGAIRALSFPGGADSACMTVTNTGSIIRIWKAEGSSNFASETIVNGTHLEGTVMRAAFTPSGSFLATSSGSTVALYELETMTKTGSVIRPGVNATCFAMSPDSKQLVVGDHSGGIRFVRTDNFASRTCLHRRGRASNPEAISVAYDPTCRVLAFGYRNGTFELRTL
jgi:WD40 repeat protein